MRIPVRLVVALLSGSLSAQCCLGAQNVESVSDNRLYRVLARSLRGTGHAVHGPYHYDFRFQELDEDGEWDTVSTFEQRWSVTKHFSMGLVVSSTGNGFLLRTSLQPGLVLYGRDGTMLRELRVDADPFFGVEGSERSCQSSRSPEWVREHADRLHWDEVGGGYTLRN